MFDACPTVTRHSAVSFVAAMLARVGLAAAMAAATGSFAGATTLFVGPGQLLRVPSQAATVAKDGDRVVIAPGVYADCAIWRSSGLTIEAGGPGVFLVNRICAYQGIFVIEGRGTTIRGLTFANAIAPYGNAAGIKLLGADLTVENSRFANNQNGILAGGPPDSVVRVTASLFEGNGSCIGACAHAIYVGAPIALLDVTQSRFSNTRTAHHIKSRARATIILGNLIEDGPSGTASYLIETPGGGDLLVQANLMHKGRFSDNASTAISIGVEGVSNPTDVLIIRDNRFISDLPDPTLFVRNSSTVPAALIGNRLIGRVLPLNGPGTVDAPAEDQQRDQ
jgi:hypothetical protein